MTFGEMNMPSHSWKYGRKTTEILTVREMQLMYMLQESPVEAEELRKVIWGTRKKMSPKTIHVHIHNLRKKIKKIGLSIRHDGFSQYALCPKD